MKLKNAIPVIIYKNNLLLKEFSSIRRAARFMKEELEREFIPWSIINKGIHQNENYTHSDGAIYSFNQADEKKCQSSRVEDNSSKLFLFLD